MKLAEGRPLRRRMMAAMAQQDCGQCGYNCNDYSDAIASKSEARLNLCVPGGKETARMLKSLYEELDKAPAAHRRQRRRRTAAAAARSSPSRAARATIRSPATFLSRRLLNKAGIGEGNLAYRFRSFRLRPRLCRRRFLRHFRPQRSRACRPDHRHARRLPYHRGRGKTLREVLLDDVSLAPAPDTLFELISFITGGAQREKARALAQGEDPDGDAATLDVMAALQKFPSVRPHPGSLRRGAGAVAAAALFDLVVAQCDARENCR